MPMHQQPVAVDAPVDVGDACRQVLVGQITDAAMLSFDHDQDDRVAPGVRHHVLVSRTAFGEAASPPPEFVRPILVPTGWPAVRRQQREAVSVVNQGEVAVRVPTDPGVGGLLSARYQFIEFLVTWAIHRNILADPGLHRLRTMQNRRRPPHMNSASAATRRFLVLTTYDTDHDILAALGAEADWVWARRWTLSNALLSTPSCQ